VDAVPYDRPVRARIAYGTAAAALAGFAAFEAWNHEIDARPFAVGVALPALLPRDAARSGVGPFWLGVAGFFVPQQSRVQVAALGWAVHAFARRALSPG
jgi:hypothetical protein